MRSFTSLVAVLVGAAAVLAQSPVINTPASLIVCQPAAITFSGGTAPYIITVLPGGMIAAAALETFPTQTAAGSYTWNVDIAAGTAVTLAIRDAQGLLNYSQQVTILAGTSTSCIGAAASAGTTSARASTTAAAASSSPASAASATSAAAATTTAAASSVSRASSATTSAPASSSSAPAASSAPATTATTATAAPAASTTAAKSGAGSLKAYGANVLALVGAAVVAIAA